MLEAKKYFSLFCKNFPNPMFIENKDGFVLEANLAACSFHHLKYEDLIGKHIRELVPPERRKSVINNFSKQMKGELNYIESYSTTQSGEVIPIEIMSYPIKYLDEIALFLLVRDISNRKKVEKDFQEKNQEFGTLFNNSPEALVYINGKGIIHQVNTRFCQLFGYRKEEMVGKSIYAGLIYPLDKKEEEKYICKKTLSEGHFNYESIRKKKDGTLFPVSISSSRVTTNDKIKGIINIYVDITERKQNEQIQKVLYNISHATISSISLSQLYSIIHKEISTVIDTTNFYIALVDKEEDKLYFPYYQDEKDDNFRSIPFSTTNSLTTYVIKTGKYLLNNNDQDKKLIAQGLLIPIGTATDKSIWLGVPLKVADKVIGAMVIQSYTNPNLYSEKDIKLMEFVSSQVATAIDRKRMEENLYESQQEFASLFRSSPEAMVYLDDKSSIIHINSRFTELFGYSLEEIKGRNINDGMIHPQDRTEEGKKIDNTLLSKTYLNYESIRKKKNGKQFPVSISTSPVSLDGKTFGIIGMYKDITIRKENEEKLINSEKRFKTLFDSAPDAYYLSTDKGKFIDGNKAAEKLIGYQKKELIGKNFLSLKLLSPFQILKASKLLARNSLGKPTGPDELTLRRKDGKLVDVEISTFPIKQNKGEYLILGIAHSIERHKELEKKLEYQVQERTEKLSALNKQLHKEIIYHKKLESDFKESEERFKLLSESAFEGILIHNKGKMIDGNRALADMFGTTVKEARGKSLFKFVTPGTALTVAKNMLLKNTGLYEGKAINVKGQVFPIEIQAKNIPFQNKILRVAAIRDISFREEAETKIKESEKKYRTLAEMLPEAVFGTNQEGRITYFNALGYKMFGYCEGDFNQGVNILKLIAPQDHAVFKKEIEKLFRTKVPKVVTYNALKKDGTKIKIEVHSNPILDEDRKPIGIRGIAMDVTKKRKAEKKIKFLSYHDKLTRLYNRAFFEEELVRLNAKRQLPLTIVIGDINGLKLINDSFGHVTGDKLIKKTAHILKKCFRKEDIVARWGGDEFSIILPHTSNQKSIKIIERVKKKCEEESSKTLPLNISLGTATKENVSKKISEIIKEAEDKMYRYKLLERKSTHSSIMFSLEKALEERDYETEAHTRRMRKYAVALGEKINLPDSKINELQLLAALHDIGKIAIADRILLKPGKLSEREWVEIKKHSEVGYRIALSSPDLASIAEGILSHHERWDGKGYPQGTKGEDIPLVSRIIAIVDAYDAMVNDRPYRKALSEEEALAELKRCSGTQFDSELANNFIQIIEEEK